MMTRMQLKYRQMQAQYEADTKRPPTRAQARAWLQPLRDAFNEMRTGEVDAVKGYAVTKLRWVDEDYARIDHCIAGFLGLTDRLFPELDTAALRKVGAKLTNGVMLTHQEVDACFRAIGKCEDLLLTVSRQALKDAAQTEMVKIELERLSLIAA